MTMARKLFIVDEVVDGLQQYSEQQTRIDKIKRNIKHKLRHIVYIQVYVLVSHCHEIVMI